MQNDTTTASTNTNPAAVTPTKAKQPRKATKAAKKPAKVKHLAKSRRTGPVAVVHGFLDKNPKMRRCDAIRALEKMGVAYYTARTQFQIWFADRKAASRKRKPKAKTAAPEKVAVNA